MSGERTLIPKGAIVTNSAVEVGTSATLILAANDQRVGAIMVSTDADWYVGDDGVDTTDGFPVATDIPFNDSLSNGAIYGVVGSGTADVRVIEVIRQ